jgi:hypothetical protein
MRYFALLLAIAFLAWVPDRSHVSAAEELPDAKPVPEVQVLPLPNGEASFQFRGTELTRYHFGKGLKRPFLYPVNGVRGRSLTRMGHPHDPTGHSHHNSVWISHKDVGGDSFWEDPAETSIRCDQVLEYGEAPSRAWMLTANSWRTQDGRIRMVERRRIEVEVFTQTEWLVLIDLELKPVEDLIPLGQTPFGLIGVRMAKTIGVHDGGGRILNSQGQRNEEEVFRRPARWVDYSGRVTEDATGGITLMDHPANVNHPAPFHVRGDGWMGACLTLERPLEISRAKPLRLRYGLWIHENVPDVAEADARWKRFAEKPLDSMERAKR